MSPGSHIFGILPIRNMVGLWELSSVFGNNQKHPETHVLKPLPWKCSEHKVRGRKVSIFTQSPKGRSLGDCWSP